MMNIGNMEGFKEYSYSEIGKRHMDLNMENQDSIFVGKVDYDTYCLAVADGVSSCKWSKKGSETAVDSVKNLALKLSNSEIHVTDSDEIRKFVVRDWKSHFHESWNDYGTTLNFVIWCKGDVVIGQIGDGLIAARLNDEFVMMTDMDEFFTVETYALSEIVLKSTFKIKCVTNVQQVVALAMTDGIGKELELSSISEFMKCFVLLVSKEERDIEIESWMAYLREKNDDDKTIGLLVLEGEA